MPGDLPSWSPASIAGTRLAANQCPPAVSRGCALIGCGTEVPTDWIALSPRTPGPGRRRPRRLRLSPPHHRPRERPPAGLETVSYNLCRVVATAVCSSCYVPPRRLQPDPGDVGDRQARAVQGRRHAGGRVLRHAQGLREPRYQTGPPDRPEHRRPAGAQRRPLSRAEARRNGEGRRSGRSRSRHRARRSARTIGPQLCRSRNEPRAFDDKLKKCCGYDADLRRTPRDRDGRLDDVRAYWAGSRMAAQARGRCTGSTRARHCRARVA